MSEDLLFGGRTCNSYDRCTCITNKGVQCKNCKMPGDSACYIHTTTGCKTVSDFQVYADKNKLNFDIPRLVKFPDAYKVIEPSKTIMRRAPMLKTNFSFSSLLQPAFLKRAPVLAPVVAPVAAAVAAVAAPVADAVAPVAAPLAAVVAPVVAAVPVVAPVVAPVVDPIFKTKYAIGTNVPGTKFKIGDKVRCAVTESLKKDFIIADYYINPSGNTTIVGREIGSGEKVTYSPSYCKLISADEPVAPVAAAVAAVAAPVAAAVAAVAAPVAATVAAVAAPVTSGMESVTPGGVSYKGLLARPLDDHKHEYKCTAAGCMYTTKNIINLRKHMLTHTDARFANLPAQKPTLEQVQAYNANNNEIAYRAFLRTVSTFQRLQSKYSKYGADDSDINETLSYHIEKSTDNNPYTPTNFPLFNQTPSQKAMYSLINEELRGAYRAIWGSIDKGNVKILEYLRATRNLRYA